MQVYFDMNYTSRSEFLTEHRRVIKSRLASSVNEICESRARSREELQNLYRRIVSYILLESGLGSPTDIAIVKETTTALQSVFPPAELGSFLEFSRGTKRNIFTNYQELFPVSNYLIKQMEQELLEGLKIFQLFLMKLFNQQSMI